MRVLTNHAPVVNMLKQNKIDAVKWPHKALLHVKGLAFDRKTAVIGSHNFTQSAMASNIEASAVINDGDFAESFCKFFENLCPL